MSWDPILPEKASRFRPAMTKGEWFSAFLPIAREAVARREFPCCTGHEEQTARYLANYASTDMVLTGRTFLLPMPEEHSTSIAINGEALSRHVNRAKARELKGEAA